MGHHVTIRRSNGTQRIPLDAVDIERATAASIGWQYSVEARCASFFDGPREVVTLWFQDGELWTSNPSESAIAAMIALADGMGARVVGDEFETYRTPTEVFVHPDDESAGIAAAARGEELVMKSKLRGRVVNGSIIAFFVLISLAASRCSA